MSVSPLLDLRHIEKSFRVRGKQLFAVRDVSLSIRKGESLGLVGESGSGKSTVGRCAIGLTAPDSGSVRLFGEELVGRSRRELRQMWQHMQMVFQDAGAALHPRMTVGRNVIDPLVARRLVDGREGREIARQLLEQVGLNPDQAEAYPFELSGGQQQRVMIARALAVEPQLLICDEPVSALDVSVQAQMMELFVKLKQKRNLSYLFISHNLPSVGQIADHIAVMYLGEIVEVGSAHQMFRAPYHPYSQALFASVLPIPANVDARRELRALPGEIPSPFDLPSGCPFHTRCPVAVGRCRDVRPPLRPVGDGHQVACHLA
ncbi:peptide/nickel transport system ATP-binding protein [Alicyclobacillus sacchari]|uniref:Peptide/nickel transport system ATP-binding protein n=1 Tax=Alicyclobacillus sacchari TaxID=392010 RepID=A0A4V3HEX9_9BACL|nr:ABC transporter ATP-binding protein [Alicyclobacillus sacchari]TDY50641.1 peptide/nickel transport system ATP-binding protein [Alicyclobacillus sacchari]GMA55611.1 peptide ABC transporter ATP-binding protein [Alicyclobacillus sacchari]